MYRKGQITVFMIIGIIILCTFAAIMLLVNTTVKEEVSTEGETIVTTTPMAFSPIQTYTENCIVSIAKQGLIIMGQQGGYIHPDLMGKYSVSEPTDADGIDLEPMRIPYWHYNVDPNKGNTITMTSLRPKLYKEEDPDMSIEVQLERFIKERIGGCLDDYRAFTQQGFEISYPLGEDVMEPTVRVGEETVSFWLKMPLHVKRGGASANLNLFSVTIPLKLKHYYDIASDITKAQQNFSFLEHQSLGLISAYSGVDMDKLPPTTGTGFDLVSTHFWMKEDVKNKLTGLLASRVPMLQMLGSHNFKHYDFPVSDLSRTHQQRYDNLIIPLRGAEDVDVRFDYYGWNPYFDINDVEGIIKPQHVFMGGRWGIVPPFGIQRYYTVYDLSYPVMITIDDPLALKAEGYKFVFALEANIRNNKKAEPDQTIPSPPPVVEESLACNKGQRKTELVKSIVVDSFTKEPVELVRVGLTIPSLDECKMGYTDDEGVFEDIYPEVYGGVVNYVKEGYLASYFPIDTYDLDKRTIVGLVIKEVQEPVIELHKYKTINISAIKVKVGKCLTPMNCRDTDCEPESRQCFFETPLFGLPQREIRYNATGSYSWFNDYYFLQYAREPLTEDEQLSITLTKVADIRYGAYSEGNSVMLRLDGDEKSEANLAPGIYKVNVLLRLNKEVIIPKDKRGMEGEDVYFDIDEAINENYIESTYDWNRKETYLKIYPEDLYTSSELTFYIPYQDILSVPITTKSRNGDVINARVIEDMQLVGYMTNISQDHRDSLEPRWK